MADPGARPDDQSAVPAEGGGSNREAASSVAAARPEPASPAELFMTFTVLALHGFGGVLPWAQRAIVEQKGWLAREEFVELLAFGQLLPGPNVVNLAIMIGDRYFGWRGAMAALAGILVAPAVLLLSVFAVYLQYSGEPLVRQAVTGMSAVAGGLIVATAIKLGSALRQRWRWLVLGVAAFVMVGVLSLPLIWTLAVLIPLGFLAAWWAER